MVASARRFVPLRIDARTVVEWMLGAQAVSLLVVLAYLWVRVSYFGDVDALALLSSHRADRPGGDSTVPWALGVHTFGDFVFPYSQALVANPWTDYPVPNSNSYPAALITLFKALTFLPYTVALGLYLALNIAGMALPVVIATRRIGLARALIVLCMLVFLTFPFIMVVDRGNVQGLLVVPLYAFAVAWREHRWRRAAYALAVASALKLYPVLLAMVLLAERRFREAAIALGAALLVTIVIFDFYPGGLYATMQGFFTALTAFTAPTPDRITLSNYSSLGMVANVCAAAFGPASSQVAWLLAHPSVCGALYLAAVVAVAFSRNLPFVVKLACVLSALALTTSLTYGYTFAFITIVIAELVRPASTVDAENGLPAVLAVALVVALVTTLVPWPFPLPQTGVSVGTVLVPAAWWALTVTALVHGYAGVMRRARAATA